MNVSLSPTLERMVEEKVKTGFYNSSSEVIRAALRLLEEQDRLRRLKLENLRQEIALGIEQADRGDLLEGEEVFRKLHMKQRKQHRRPSR